MLHTKEPREQNGRDSFSRYKAQVRSAAMASLAILEGSSIDRIYCDLHDDFVIRRKDVNGFSYIFYQVKTKCKQNHNWTLGEVFGLKTRVKDQSKQTPSKIKDSFVGKLLLHTVLFDKYCNSVVFQTNINNSDDVDNLLKDVESGKFENKFSKALIDKFNDCYDNELSTELTEDDIKEKIKKLRFETDVQYLKENNNNFKPLVGEKIYEYSEIDLGRLELEEIILKLLDLIERKSCSIIKEITSENIEKYAGVSIDDLLSVLSISKDAYYNLLNSGDSKAIKSASIIQRTLQNAGSGTQEIEYCTRCKNNWDLWIRNNRHVISELDLNAIIQRIRKLFLDVAAFGNQILLSSLKEPLEETIDDLKSKKLLYDLNNDLLLGAFLSELVRVKS